MRYEATRNDVGKYALLGYLCALLLLSLGTAATLVAQTAPGNPAKGQTAAAPALQYQPWTGRPGADATIPELSSRRWGAISSLN